MTTTEKQEEIHRTAEALFSRAPDWVTFYGRVLGLRGVVRQNFRTSESLSEFQQTETYQEIQEMLTKLRRRGPAPSTPEDPTQVITVRLPKSLHDALRVEADEHHTSMNKLCISKLLQFIEHERVPGHI